MSTKTPKLNVTSDYSKFTLCDFNRSVLRTKSLRESMKRHGFIPAYPVHVIKTNKGLEVKGGHHRFHVARELQIPFYYVVCEDAATIHELEKATNQWKPADFLNSFVRAGLPAYLEVSEFHKSTGIPLGLCISLLGGICAGSSSNKLDEFKTGAFQVTDQGRAHGASIASVLNVSRGVNPKASDSFFIRAISRCLFVPEFDPRLFLSRLEANWALFKPCKNVDQMADLIETIYNTNARSNRLPLKFLTDKIMKERLLSGLKTERKQSE